MLMGERGQASAFLFVVLVKGFHQNKGAEPAAESAYGLLRACHMVTPMLYAAIPVHIVRTM